MNKNNNFVNWFRQSAPYIRAFRGKTFVIYLDTKIFSNDKFHTLAQDISLMNSLGIRQVLVFGTRTLIDKKLKTANKKSAFHNNIRITDDTTLQYIKEITGEIRINIEATLSMGIANSPMAGSNIKIISGNFVTAQPKGIVEGVDFQHTGCIRKIDHDAIDNYLENSLVLIPPIGTSPTGEIFNLTSLEVASEVAISLNANKLIILSEFEGVKMADDTLIRHLAINEAKRLINCAEKIKKNTLTALKYSVAACSNGVTRAHIINENIDGALLNELFTRDGIGTMISTDVYHETRQAKIADIGGVLNLISPLESSGALVRRSREQIEMSINEYFVVEKDKLIIACAALHIFEKESFAELACLAIHNEYQNCGIGRGLLKFIEEITKNKKIKTLFVLTTNTRQWFEQHGFKKTEINQLPLKKKSIYNYKRNSVVLMKSP